MTRPIVQTAKFNAPAQELYEIYLDPKRHAAFTGGPVKISAKAGSRFKAFGGMLEGWTILTISGKMIVQRWRSNHFRKTDSDSILILMFSNEGKKGRIDLVHVNVPEQDHAGVRDGWERYYWGALRGYLREIRK